MVMVCLPCQLAAVDDVAAVAGAWPSSENGRNHRVNITLFPCKASGYWKTALETTVYIWHFNYGKSYLIPTHDTVYSGML